LFPEEIRQYPQWICWKYAEAEGGKLTKLPYSPRTGRLASVSDPSSWTDYDTACSIAMQSNGFYSGIGFVLAETDPFCFIDLDDPGDDPELQQRHMCIAQAMDSYTELSPSGKGLHIIVKATVPGGRRRNKVELYSSQRYMTMTGQTWLDKPINERQFFVQQLWAELDHIGNASPTASLAELDHAQVADDPAIYHIATTADNGDKFLNLWNGNWQEYYKSQSEADFALINILGFYSRNSEQIRRMFLLSALGKRDKAKRRAYLDGMIKRSFDNMPPDIPLEQIKMQVANELAKREAAKDRAAIPTSQPANPFAGPLFQNLPDPGYDWTMPPGLIGEITQFIYQAAPRPVKEIALGAAIGLMAGICGRAYNVSGTGLNQYVLILAKTGSGKEGAASGIDRIMQQLRRTVPAAMDFIGPAEISSGQALEKYIAKNPCFVSIVGEFGLMMQRICSPAANSSEIALRRTLLSLYNKSGADDIQRQRIYSDKDKNTEVVRSPAFSILGESTPESFYASLDESMISQGVLPRFTCIEYLGKRPELNKAHRDIQPSETLIQNIAQLAANCLMLAQHNKTINVALNDEAQRFADEFNSMCDAKINTSELEVARQLWNRAHIKTLKLGALIAIGLNPYLPVITLECIQWAAGLVERDVLNILMQFDVGKAGRETGELNQINEVCEMVADYIKRPYLGLEKYGVIPKMHSDRVIALAYLQRRCLSKGPFKNDRVGATNALKRTLENLINEGALQPLKDMQTYQFYGKTMKCYVIVDAGRFIGDAK
jgi:hypothetical protein